MDSGTEQQPASLPAAARRGLTLTMIAVAGILVGIAGIGHRDGGWPIVTWPMYSTNTTYVPPPIASQYEFRVVDTDGTSHVFPAGDFVPAGWLKPMQRIVRSAYQDSLPGRRDSSRVYIVRLIARTIPPERIARIEGWRRDWACDPYASPPVDYDRPLRDVTLGAFTIDAYLALALPD